MEDSVEREVEFSDAELVDEFKAGKEWAFNELLRRHSKKILTLCTYYLKDADQAYDVSQEVFIKVYRSLGKFSTWLHTIAVNTCKNKLSFWKRMKFWKQKFEVDPLSSRLPREPDFEVFQGERQRLVREEIASLADIHRQVILLKDIQGLSYEEICQILNISQGTLKSRLHRAREALAKRLTIVLGEDGF